VLFVQNERKGESRRKVVHITAEEILPVVPKTWSERESRCHFDLVLEKATNLLLVIYESSLPLLDGKTGRDSGLIILDCRGDECSVFRVGRAVSISPGGVGVVLKNAAAQVRQVDAELHTVRPLCPRDHFVA